MLVTLSEILQLAEAKKCAVGSFNTPNLESIMAVIGAAEELNVPVIIMHAEVHEPMMPISVIGPIMIERASTDISSFGLVRYRPCAVPNEQASASIPVSLTNASASFGSV